MDAHYLQTVWTQLDTGRHGVHNHPIPALHLYTTMQKHFPDSVYYRHKDISISRRILIISFPNSAALACELSYSHEAHRV